MSKNRLTTDGYQPLSNLAKAPVNTRNQLEENILRDGIQDPLKIWQGIIIDGHNRYEIAKAHGLDFATVEMTFTSRDDAIIWIIKNQFGRRNLSAYDRSILALKLKPVIAAKAKENLSTHTADGYQGCQISDKAPIDTKKEIAKAAGVSHDTIRKVERIEQQATPEIKQLREEIAERFSLKNVPKIGDVGAVAVGFLIASDGGRGSRNFYRLTEPRP